MISRNVFVDNSFRKSFIFKKTNLKCFINFTFLKNFQAYFFKDIFKNFEENFNIFFVNLFRNF
jgi:hypothetical protein